MFSAGQILRGPHDRLPLPGPPWSSAVSSFASSLCCPSSILSRNSAVTPSQTAVTADFGETRRHRTYFPPKVKPHKMAAGATPKALKTRPALRVGVPSRGHLWCRLLSCSFPPPLKMPFTAAPVAVVGTYPGGDGTSAHRAPQADTAGGPEGVFVYCGSDSVRLRSPVSINPFSFPVAYAILSAGLV